MTFFSFLLSTATCYFNYLNTPGMKWNSSNI